MIELFARTDFLSMGQDMSRRISLKNVFLCGIYLSNPNVAGPKNKLTIQVMKGNSVMINKIEVLDTRSYELLHHIRTDASQANYYYSTRADRPLRCRRTRSVLGEET